MNIGVPIEEWQAVLPLVEPADIVTNMIPPSIFGPVRGGCLRRFLLLGALLAGLLWTLLLAVRIELAGRRDEAVRSHAVVVLGAAQYQGTPSAIFRARLDHALWLYERGVAPLVVVAGGRLEGDRYTEASAGTCYLRQRGVPASALLAVGEGNNTLESLEAVARVLGRRDAQSAVLVSDRFHMYRSLQMAPDLGLRAVGSPTTTSPVDGKPTSRLRYTLREVVAYTAYVLANL
ncbi:MAG: YdcF family protein [Chloroflexota bacterium]|nr:YdcF family protein [Chloroflexota bacterium]